MGLLSKLENFVFQDVIEDKSFNFNDKKVKKLNLGKVQMHNWVCVENAQIGRSVLSVLLGEDWEHIPVSMLYDTLQLRFGDEFHDKNENFNFDTWSVLWHFHNNLSNDQKEFLKKNHFLPHKYLSAKESLAIVEKTLLKLEIKRNEHIDSQQEDIVRQIAQDIENSEEKREELKSFIKDWEKSHPDGGNPADASEYYSDSIELREWCEEHDELLQLKKADAYIFSSNIKRIRQQQYTKDKTEGFFILDFGHQKERERRFKLKQKQSVAIKNSSVEVDAGKEMFYESSGVLSVYSPSTFSAKELKPIITNAFSNKTKSYLFPQFISYAQESVGLDTDKKAKESISEKKKVSKPLGEPMKNKEESFEEILAEAKKRVENYEGQSQQETFKSKAAEKHKQKMMDKIKNQQKDKQVKTVRENWPKKIAIGVVVTVVTLTVIYLIFA